MLSCIYLGHSGNTVLISDLQFENDNDRKYRETIYKGGIILDSLKGISCWESWIGVPNTILSFWVCNTYEEYVLSSTPPSSLVW